MRGHPLDVQTLSTESSSGELSIEVVQGDVTLQDGVKEAREEPVR